MQEYIVSYQGHWWHFFYKPSYGLCFRKKDGMRFGDFEILLKESESDFCVFSAGKFIHIVCQDHVGTILYLSYNGENWEKLPLLTNKEGKATPKHFSLLAVGNRLNLYYVIEYKEKNMLIHQLLHAPSTEPMVADYITATPCPYHACLHSSNNLTVCYQNTQGICGMRTYLWSQKSYQPFRKIPFSALSSPTMLLDEDDTCHFAAVTELEGVRNLIYFRRESDGSFSDSSTIYLDCGENPEAVFFRKDNRLYLEWLDNGSVMMSYISEENEKWKKPVKYMRNATTPVVLYHICEEGKTNSYYGFSDNGTINLYGEGNLLSESPKASPLPKYRPRGFEASEFAKQFGYQPRETEASTVQEFISVEEYQKEHAKIKQLLSKQNDIVLDLLQRISKLEENLKNNTSAHDNSSPAQNEEDIDTILFNEKEIKKPSDVILKNNKVVVTAK